MDSIIVLYSNTKADKPFRLNIFGKVHPESSLYKIFCRVPFEEGIEESIIKNHSFNIRNFEGAITASTENNLWIGPKNFKFYKVSMNNLGEYNDALVVLLKIETNIIVECTDKTYNHEYPASVAYTLNTLRETINYMHKEDAELLNFLWDKLKEF